MAHRANIITAFSCAILVPWQIDLVHGANQEVIVHRQQDVPAESPDSAIDTSHNGSQQIEQWIEALGSDQYAQRQRAEIELVRLGADAYDQLKSVENHPDLEIASRVTYILQRIKVEWARQEDSPAVRKVMVRYGELSLSSRLDRIEQVAALKDEQGLGALCRIARFDPSPLLSRYAALAVIRVENLPETRVASRQETIRIELGRSDRTASTWMKTYATQLRKPDRVAPRWKELIRAEASLFAEGSHDTDMDVVLELIRHHLNLCDTLLHANTEGDLSEHFDWAVRQWHNVIDSLPIAGSESISARNSLSMWLHDREQHLDAAKVLKVMVDAIQNDPKNTNRVKQSQGWHAVLSLFRSRMEYYFACHAESQGDFEAQRTHLEAAVAHSEIDADVLIAMYRMQGADEQYHRKTVERISRASKHLLQQIRKNPDRPDHYNHWAWLIANTEGDYQKALAYSQRSLELQPNEASLLDTLSRCYYANDDLENAIKHQRMAVELDPHLQALHRQLKFFEQKLAKKGS